MHFLRRFNRNHRWWRTLRQAVTIGLLASLLAGLIPQPLVMNVVDLTGFQNLSGLPEPAAARAASAEEVAPALADKPVAAPDAASLAAPVANPNRALAESLWALPAFQAATDIDLITNINSDKSVVIPNEAVAFTVTVENRGPAAATNVDWLVEIGSADTITNTGCTSSGGATCPADFTISVPEATAQLTAVIPSMPADSNITLTFDTTTAYLQGAAKAVSTVTPNGQTDAVSATNQADINISIIAPALSYAVAKSVSFEDAGGNPIVTPTSGDYAIWEVVITNDGIDDVYDLYMEDFASVLVGTGDVRTDGQYAPGTTFESMTCVNAANGAVCPPDITYTEIELGQGDVFIPYLPGRTRSAASNPAAYPASSVTIEFRMLIGDIECSTTGGFRTFSNRVQLYGDDQNPNMGAPYGAGVYDDDDATATFDVAAPTCDQYDVATQITEPVLQSTNGVTGGGPFEYTVTVVNNGPDGVTDVPFVFGLYHATYWQVPDPYINLWTIDSNIVCTPSGGAVCPTAYTINAQETFTNATTGVVTSGSLQPPDLEATIPNLPSGGSLVFTIAGTAGELTDCTPVTLYHNAYAHALPISALSETNINLPNTSSFASYYLRTSSGFPAAALTNGSYYGNNGYNLQTQWVTGNGSTCPGDDPVLDYDLSTQMTGPFANPGDVTPIAGPLAPGQLVYYRVIANNLDDGDDTLNFGNPTTDSTVPYAQAYLQVRNFLGFASSFPSWLDRTTGESGFGFADPELAHALDTTPNRSSMVPWAAWQAIGATCVSTSGGAQCPEANDEVYWGSFNGYGDLAFVSVPASGNLGDNPSDAGHELEGLSLPVGSSIEFVLPYRVPPATVSCVPGGAIFTASGSNSGPQAEIQSWPNTISVNYFQTTTDYDPNYPRYLERNDTNDRSTLTIQVEIPACVAALEIDKQIVAPAASDLIPESGLVQYTVDLTYPATSTQALDVAQFTDVPSLTCANYPFNSSSQAAYNACAEYTLVNVVGCSVVSGNATCPPSIPIGQQLAQDGTLTAINTGTIDTRWGTPNATTVAGGAAFEPGSTIRITLEAQLSNEVSPVNTLVNRATYASDADSSQFGSGLFAEDSEVISPPDPDSMVLRKQVSPTDAQQGETIVYTLEAINNGLNDGQGAYIVDTVPADLLAANPTGFTNLACTAITTNPPLMAGPNTADCANVSITNNGAAGFRIDMTGSWPLNSGYRFTFEAIAPFSGTSIDNTAVLTPPPASNSQRFGPMQDSTANFRTPDGAVITLDKVVVTPTNTTINMGDPVIYDLVITNLGPLTVTEVTVVDHYDTDYLQFDSASETPIAQSSGTLTWTITTPTAPLPLAVGEALTVTVEFVATKP